MISLYPDQNDLLNDVRAQMAARKRYVLMQAATGSGKTVMAASLVHGALAKGTRCLMVVPRRQLLRQSALTFTDYNIPFGYCAAGYQSNPFAQVHLATSGTLLNRLGNEAPKASLVIIDETHFGGEGLDKIVAFYKKTGAWIVGLSATPERLDGKGLGCWYDSMVCGKPIDWLIANNRLSDYRLFAPSRPNLEGIKTVAGDYAKGELAARMEADQVIVGDAVKYYREQAMGRLNVAYCTSRKHSQIVAGKFRDAGIPAMAIDGETPDDERTRIIKAFARREILVLANCELLTFGFDLSAASGMDVTVEAMSDLRPTKSLALQMQKWGRVLRRKDYPALIFDHGGNAAMHGLPDDPRQWSLTGRPKKKSKGADEETTVPHKQCSGGYKTEERTGDKMPPCYFTHRPAPRCPNCGAWYPVQSRMVDHIDGELKEVGRGARREFSVSQLMRIAEQTERIAKNAIAKGVPHDRAYKWAAKKVTEEYSL